MSRIGESFMAAISAFRTSWVNGAVEAPGVRNAYANVDASYKIMWGYYANSSYDMLMWWSAYRDKKRLYRHTRSLYNPVRRLVDLYAGLVWPGVLTMDKDIPKHVPVATPIPPDTPENIRAAIDQLFQWTNFASQRYALVRYGACLGNVMVEIIDDLDSGKIAFDVMWPGFVKDLKLDYSGHVKEYTIEYQFEDQDDGRVYTYRREVTQESISTYRDREPHSYDGVPARYDNPYGFAPAVWVPHSNVGGIYAAPAIRNIDKIDELNSMVSHINDQTHKILSAPIILAVHSPDATLPAVDDVNSYDVTDADQRETINFLEANTGAQAQTITLPQGQSLEHLEALLGEVERDHPELAMWPKLREMTQISGIAAERLFGDVLVYVREAQANYDASLIRLCQMSMAIGGMRAAEGKGGWAESNYQRDKFKPFNLDSYKKGDLDFTILSRPLVPPTEQEAMQIQILQAQVDRLEMEMQQPQVAADRDVQVQLPNSIYGRLRGVAGVPKNQGGPGDGPQATASTAQDMAKK